MKKSLLAFLFCLSIFAGFAQSTATSYKLKAEYLRGDILPLTSRLKSLIQEPVNGVELALEYQTVGEKPWHYYLNFPIVGVGTTWLNLGNPTKLGDAFAIYHYIVIPAIRNKYFNIGVKAGAGVSFLTKTYYDTNRDANGNILPYLVGTNSAIGSVMNVYFAGGGNVEVPLKHGLSLTAEYTWNHMSNGSVIAPNEGLNLLNGLIGLKYSPNYRTYRIPQQREIRNIPRKFSTEIIVSGGIRQLYYKDQQFFPIGSVTVSEFYPLSNFYRMGIGVDAFYDGVFGAVYISDKNPLNTTKYEFTYITENKLMNKIRAGVSWQHEMMIGKLTAGVHVGLYLYDPIKNLQPYSQAVTQKLNKGLIYPYNIEEENGWLYTRASLKYSINQHLFASIGLKTHLQKAEFIEWGLGYRFSSK